jgi:hypothetical protein
METYITILSAINFIIIVIAVVCFFSNLKEPTTLFNAIAFLLSIILVLTYFVWTDNIITGIIYTMVAGFALSNTITNSKNN